MLGSPPGLPGGGITGMLPVSGIGARISGSTLMDGHNAPSDHASLSPSGSVRWPMVLPSDEPCLRHRFRGRAFSCEYGGGRRCLSRDGVAGAGGRRRCLINIDGKRPARAEVPRDAWNGAGIGTAHHRELNVHSPPDRGSLAGFGGGPILPR